jgi:hypothetical protein
VRNIFDGDKLQGGYWQGPLSNIPLESDEEIYKYLSQFNYDTEAALYSIKCFLGYGKGLFHPFIIVGKYLILMHVCDFVTLCRGSATSTSRGCRRKASCGIRVERMQGPSSTAKVPPYAWSFPYNAEAPFQ